MNADGSGTPLQVTPSGGQGKDTPTWSPNGSRIAYANRSQIRAVNPAGGNDVQFLAGLREVWDVAWSPDGSRIAYVNDPGTNIAVQEELFVMNADGSGSAPVGVDTDIRLDWGVPSTLPAPVLGKTVNVATVSGKVFVSVPAGSAFASLAVPGIKGRRFVPLSSPRQLPGRLDPGYAQGLGDPERRLEQGGPGVLGLLLRRRLPGAAVAQRADHPAAEGLELPLLRGASGPGVGGAEPAGDPPYARQRQRALPYPRALQRGHGARHDLGYLDRCDGTLTKVTRGTVVVRDFRKRRNITVRAGKSYLARAPG